MSDRIPIHGAFTRPAGPDDAAAELALERFPAPSVTSVTFKSEEFTAVCPKTGQPDFNVIEVEYEPDQWCLESKSIKFYLWSFREHGAYCESLSAIIRDHVVAAIEPKAVKVTVHQKPRGGVALVAVAEYRRQG